MSSSEKDRPNLLAASEKVDNVALSEHCYDVGELFAHIVQQVKENASPDVGPVDVEIKLDSVSVNEKGFFVFSKKTQTSTISISLSARIIPAK